MKFIQFFFIIKDAKLYSNLTKVIKTLNEDGIKGNNNFSVLDKIKSAIFA